MGEFLDIVVHCDPVVLEADDDVGLNITFATLDCSVKEWLASIKWLSEKTIVGPMGMPITFYIQDYETELGPIFIEDLIVFKPFAIVREKDQFFHCDDCGRIIIKWFVENQVKWARTYHADYYRSFRKGSSNSKRVH